MVEHAFSLTGFTGLSANVTFGGSCKIQRRGLCLSCKIHGEDYVLVVKFMGGIMSTYTKMRRGDFVQGGGGWILSISHGIMSTARPELPYPCFSGPSLGSRPFRVESNVTVVVTCIIHWFNVLGVRLDVICKLETLFFVI